MRQLVVSGPLLPVSSESSPSGPGPDNRPYDFASSFTG